MESNHAIILGVCFIFVLLGLIGGLAGLDSGSGGNITQNITYNNTTIGGGNGSGTTDHYNLTNLTFESSGHTSDTSKVNRSGDTMTGQLNNTVSINSTNINIDNQSFFQEIGHSYQFNPVLGFWYPNGSSANTVANNQVNFDVVFSNSIDGIANNTLALFQNIGNSSAHFNFFQGRVANGVCYPENRTCVVYPIPNNKVLFRIVGTGWDGSAWGGSRTTIDLVADGDWNTTSHPTRIDMYTTDVTGNQVKRATIDKTGAMTLYGLAGSGNAYVCTDANGVLFRSSFPCV